MSSKGLITKYSPDKKADCFFTQKCIQVSSTGEYIFCHCARSINIVEFNSGNVVRKIESEEDEISSFSLSPNNSILAVGYNSSSIRNYGLKDISESEPQLQTSFKSFHRGPVRILCFDSSSVLLASGSSDGTVRVWDVMKKYCTHSLKGALGVIGVLMFDKNLHKRPWLFGTASERIYIWLLQAGSSEVVSVLEGHDSSVTGLQITHTGDELISSGLDKVIIVWDLNTFTSKRIIPMFESLTGIIIKPPDMDFFNVSLEEEDNIVFTIGNQGLPRIWNVDRGKEIWKRNKSIVPTMNDQVLLFNQMVFVKALKSFALSTFDNNIIFIRADSMEVWKQFVGFNGDILDAIFLGKDQTHTAVATNSSQLRVYEVATNNCRLISGHTAIIFALAKAPRDEYIFGSSSADHTARIWRLTEDGSADCLAIARGHTNSVGSLVLGLDFMLTGSKDTCIKKWSLNLKSLTNQSVSDLFSTTTQIAHAKDINGLAVSKNFNLVASCSPDKTAKIWDAKSLTLLGVLNGHKKGIWCVQFSPTDCVVATGSTDGTIKIWTLTDYTNVATLEGHESTVLRFSWISKGQQLVSIGSDGLLKIWMLKNNTCVNTIDEHDGKTWTLSVANDGEKLVTGGSDSKLVWWKDVTEEERQKELEEKQRMIEEEQSLMNLLHDKKYSKALRIALRLRQPFRGLAIMKTLLDEAPSQLPKVLSRLKSEEIVTLAEYAVQWNTKTKNVREAQSVINFLMRERLPEDLEEIPDWKKILEGLLPFTEKHLKRISALHQSISIINYMTTTMTLQEPEEFDKITDEKVDEETALLSTIPKGIPESAITVPDETMEVSDDDDSEESDDELSEDMNELEDGDTAPLDSVDDIRGNFVYEKITAESDDDDEMGESSESGIGFS